MRHPTHGHYRQRIDGPLWPRRPAFLRIPRPAMESPIYRVLQRLLGGGEDPRDACQEVFLRVYGARNRYRADGAFSTWLYRIALNVARDMLRRRKSRAPGSIGSERVEYIPDHRFPKQATQSELAGALEVALTALPHQAREALVLKHFGELTFDEVAQLTGVPCSTIKSRVRAALEQLRVELQKQGVDERMLGA